MKSKVQPGTGHEGSHGGLNLTSTPSLPPAVDVVVGSKYAAATAPTLGKETWYLLHRRLGGPQG